MRFVRTPPEATVERRAFEAWSIEIPESFEEVFVAEDAYWHAYGKGRSVSLTSIVLTEVGEPVSADRILERALPFDGSPVERVPPGLLGGAATSVAPRSAIASRLLTGLIATTGRVLLVTITCDDLEWARRVWLSIRSHPVPLQSTTGQRRDVAARWVH